MIALLCVFAVAVPPAAPDHIERDVRRVELENRRWQVDFERDALGLEVARLLPGGVRSSWQRDTVGGRCGAW